MRAEAIDVAISKSIGGRQKRTNFVSVYGIKTSLDLFVRIQSTHLTLMALGIAVLLLSASPARPLLLLRANGL